MWASLGWLRFGLALIVAAYHLRGYYGSIVPRWDPTHIIGSFNGMAAVLGFLLVSGFSISHSLVQKPHGYYRRRFLRIYPMYVLAIALSVWVGAYSVPTASGAGTDPRFFDASGGFQIVANALLLQGVIAEPLTNNAPLWTLSLEWWLYLLAPFLLALSARKMGVLLAVLVFGNLTWIVLGPRLGHYSQTLAFLNLWFLGIFWVLGFWYYLNREKPAAPWIMIALVWFVTGLNRESLSLQAQVALVWSCVVLVAGGMVNWPRLLDRLGRTLGNASYPLYLIHLPLYALLYRFEVLHHGWLMLGLTVGASIFCHLILEKPLRTLFIAVGAQFKPKA